MTVEVNRPFAGYLLPRFQNEVLCNTFQMKITLIHIKNEKENGTKLSF